MILTHLLYGTVPPLPSCPYKHPYSQSSAANAARACSIATSAVPHQGEQPETPIGMPCAAPPTPQPGPRAVILLGPPKTGSTHLQSFLAANQANLHRAGWEWPHGVDGQPAGPKSYANLVGALTNRSCRTTFWTEAPTLVDAIMSYCHGTNSEKVAFQGAPAPVLAAFRQEFRRIANANRNLVLSAEVSLMLSPAVRRALSPSTVGTTATFRAPAGPRLPR